MDFLSKVYQSNRDIFYLVSSYLNPSELLRLSSCNRLYRYVLYHCAYQNLWLRWWTENVSAVVLPMGCLETQRRDVCQYLSRSSIPQTRVAFFTGQVKEHIASGHEIALFRALKPDANFTEILQETVRAGHTHIFKQILERGYVIDRKKDRLAFQLSMWFRAPLEIISTFFEAGFPLNEDCSYEGLLPITPLGIALNKGYLALAEYLLEQGADPKVMEERLIENATHNIDSFKFLVKLHVPVHLYPNEICVQLRILHEHLGIYNKELIEYLLGIIDFDLHNKTILLNCTIKEGDIDGIRMLLTRGAVAGQGSLGLATRSGSLEVVRLVHQHGGDYDQHDNNILYVTPEIVRYFVTHFVLPKFHLRELLGRFLLGQNNEMVTFLCQHEAEIYADGCEHILRQLVTRKQLDPRIVSSLLAVGAEVDDDYFITNVAKFSGSVEIVQMLLDAGGIVRHQALVNAAVYGHIDLVKFFLDRGMKVEIDNYDVFSRAIKAKRHDIIRLFLQRQLIPKEIWQIEVDFASKSKQSKLLACLHEFDAQYQQGPIALQRRHPRLIVLPPSAP